MSVSDISKAFIDSLANRVERKRPNMVGLADLVRSLAPLGISSTGDLVRALPALSGEQLIAALNIAGILKLRRAGPQIVPLMESSEPGVRWHAQIALSDMASRRTYRPLARMAISHPDPEVEYQACYAISWTHDAAAAPILLSIYLHPRISARVKGQAAEGLANTLGWSDRRKQIFKQAASALIAGLANDSAEVRFWTCFALGQMRARQALPHLRAIVQDDSAFCPGWWYVREEASDAIDTIEDRSHPDRECLGWTETGEPRVP